VKFNFDERYSTLYFQDFLYEAFSKYGLIYQISVIGDSSPSPNSDEGVPPSQIHKTS
jgi:hypothetical protein